MEDLVAPIPVESQKMALDDKSNMTQNTKRPAPSTGGCRIEGYVRVKKVISYPPKKKKKLISYKNENIWKYCFDILGDHKGTVIAQELFNCLVFRCELAFSFRCLTFFNLCYKQLHNFGNNNAAVIA